jgi:hypothetical protein
MANYEVENVGADKGRVRQTRQLALIESPFGVQLRRIVSNIIMRHKRLSAELGLKESASLWL